MSIINELSTEDLILQKLEGYRKYTAHDLAVECGLEEPTVRYHLRKLCSRGLIQAFADTTGGLKPGRKAPYYRRVNPGLNKNIHQLCGVLMQYLSHTAMISTSETAHLIAELFLLDDPDWDERKFLAIRGLMDWLNRNNYQAGWEAGKAGPIIKFANCPFREIRAENDILCQVDMELLRLLNGQSWEMVQSMNWRSLQGNCLFIVKADTNR